MSYNKALKIYEKACKDYHEYLNRLSLNDVNIRQHPIHPDLLNKRKVIVE